MRFSGTANYVATDDLKVAVNAAITLERPLLVKGEPGTGKSVLAEEVAKALHAPLIAWHVKSTTKAQQGLYEYDAVSRLRDSQLGDPRVSDISNYIRRGKLWEAFASEARPVLLIDEIDKADIEFPNDLLLELDRMEFHVYETGETVKARVRPVVIVTSNNEKELPDAFLRRCFFHYIRFPDAETMGRIVDVHFPGIKKRLVEEALRVFFEVREVPGLKKKPSTSELLDWLKLLVSEDIGPETLRERDPRKLIPPLHGALLKNEQDVSLFEKLGFAAQGERRARAQPFTQTSTLPVSLMVIGLPKRSRALPAETRIQPSETQYSSTLFFSTPLKRTPISWRVTMSWKCGLAGFTDRRSGKAWVSSAMGAPDQLVGAGARAMRGRCQALSSDRVDQRRATKG